MKKIYSFWKKRLWTGLFIAVMFSLTANATVWPIPNTATDTLLKFVKDTSKWEPGDTIMVSDASVYTVYGTIDFFQEGTIMGNPDLTTKPTLKFEDNGFRAKEDSISISIIGLKLDGYKSDGSRRNYAIRFDQASWQNWNDITIKDCEIWGFKGVAQLFKNKWAIYESFTMDNCLVYDLAGDYVIDPKLNAVKSLTVTNSTFYDIATGFITNVYFSDGSRDTIAQTILIDHNTFFNVAGSNWNKSLIQMNDATDGSIDFTFSNNIVQQLYLETESRAFMINELAGDFIFKYSVFFDFYSTYDGGKWNLDTLVQNLANVDTLKIYKDDPNFADTANRYFTLPTNSPLLTAGSDGGAIGDPRWVTDEEPWVPGPNVHAIPNDSTNVLAYYLDTLTDGSMLWESGDTLLLTSSSMYHTTRTSNIWQDVTIMGDPRLTVRPSIYFEDQGFNFKEDSISLVVEGFKAIGWDPSDSSGMGNLFVRADQTHLYDGSYFSYLIIEDVECVGFNGFFQLDKSKASIYDSVIVNNCIIHDLGNKYLTFDFYQNKVTYASITNTTVYGEPKGVFGEFWAADTSAGSTDVPYNKTVVFNHNTVYNTVGGASFIAVHNIKDETMDITVSNNIISTLYENTNSRPFRLDQLSGSIDFANNVFHNYNSSRTGGYYNLDSIIVYYPSVVTAVNTDTTNPYFADPLAGSFMLADSSSLLSAGTEGGPIGDPRWVPVAGVTINPLETAVVEGIDVTLTAEVNISGADKTVTWSVVNGTGTATINATTGVLSPLTPGTVTVTATSNFNPAFSDELLITIETKIYVTGIDLAGTDAGGNPSTEITNYPGFLNVTATITPGNAHDKSLTWSISKTSDGKATIVEVNATQAKVDAIQCGTVYAVAMANDGSGVKDSLEITLTNQTPVQTVTVSAEGGTAEISTDNGTLQMIATVTPDTACIKVVDWSVDNENIATIDESTGLLTAVANGTVTVTARSTDGTYKTGTLDVTISNQVTSVNNLFTDKMLIIPNPASNYILVQTEQNAEVIMNNIVGSVVLSTVVEPNTSIDISGLNAGIYIVSVKSGNQVSTIRLIKE